MNTDIMIYLIVNALRVGLAVYFLSIFLEKKRPLWFYAVAGMILWGVNSFAYIVININWLTLASNLIGLGIIALTGYKGRFLNTVLVLLLDITVGIAAENIAYYLFVHSETGISSYADILSVFLFLMITLIIDRSISSYRSSDIALIPGMILIAITFGLFFTGNMIIYEVPDFMVELSLCVLMIISISIVYLYDSLRKHFAMQKETSLYKLQSDMYKKQLEILQRSDEETRILRHDFKHHILMLREYSSNGEKDKLTAYLESLSEAIGADETLSYTGNNVTDSVINYYRTQLEAIGGRFDTDIALTDDMSIDDYDLNALLSNLLSNAYEAVQSVQDPCISLSMRYNRGILGIRISNPYSETHRHGSRVISSGNPDRSDHGIGLISVRHIVEKYDGCIEINDENNVFTVNIAIHVA
jgi:signal transduction histidine kinase